MFKQPFDEQLYDYILEQLVEHSEQIVELRNRSFFFEEFHYDGVLLYSHEEDRQVYCGKWWVQELVIIN